MQPKLRAKTLRHKLSLRKYTATVRRQVAGYFTTSMLCCENKPHPPKSVARTLTKTPVGSSPRLMPAAPLPKKGPCHEKRFLVSLHLQNTTMEKFSAEAVYDVMSYIPKGKVVTYGEIAILIGQPQKAAHVGCAMKGAFERGLPCHRVVFSDGGLVPNWPQQVDLLKAEGVVIKKNGKVDLKRCAWRPLETIDL